MILVAYFVVCRFVYGDTQFLLHLPYLLRRGVVAVERVDLDVDIPVAPDHEMVGQCGGGAQILLVGHLQRYLYYLHKVEGE